MYPLNIRLGGPHAVNPHPAGQVPQEEQVSKICIGQNS